MKGQRHGWKVALLVVALALLTMLVMDFNSRTAELSRLTLERERVAQQATQSMQTQTALEAQIDYATSEAAVVRWAYEEAHMVKPGDVPVVPISPQGEAPAPTPTPAPTPVPMQNWERWVLLFTGPRTP